MWYEVNGCDTAGYFANSGDVTALEGKPSPGNVYLCSNKFLLRGLTRCKICFSFTKPVVREVEGTETLKKRAPITFAEITLALWIRSTTGVCGTWSMGARERQILGRTMSL